MPNRPYTIKDIAELAGVSKGTVDRVLHKRGKVSDKAQDKVAKILEKIEYQPNPIARNLRINKTYEIGVLIPDVNFDPYWIPAYEGIDQAVEEFRSFGVVVEKYEYNPYDKIHFTKKSEEVIKRSPDALLMSPIFHDESLRVLEQCTAKKIRVAFFNNHINTLRPEAFIGQDLKQSGKIAAGLIYKIVGPTANIGIVHIDQEPHMQLKEDGFKCYFRDQGTDLTKLSVQIFSTENIKGFEKEVGAFLRANPSVSALFVTNSKAYKLTSILEKNNYRCVVIGYDLLEENIEYLKKGKIDFLIHQRPKMQAYLAVSYFAESLLFGKKVPEQKLLPIDIVTSENIDYYL